MIKPIITSLNKYLLFILQKKKKTSENFIPDVPDFINIPSLLSGEKEVVCCRCFDLPPGCCVVLPFELNSPRH